MATNCSACKWMRIRRAGQAAMSKIGVTTEMLDAECARCLESFKVAAGRKPRTCYGCEWKDRELPYEARQERCRACAEIFARQSGHDCATCVWNDPKRRQPTDATLAHCKACLGAGGGKSGAMNCDSCGWKDMPEESKRSRCIACSMRFSSNAKVRCSTNELSNKGQTIISYDNHNSSMTDDRDTVTQIDVRYAEARRSASKAGSEHPVHALAFNADMGSGEYAEAAYEKMKAFLYELGQLTDMQALLFLSEVKGEKKTAFARNHNMTDTAVNNLFKQILVKSPVFHDFIVLTRGSVRGTRGRKPKDGTYLDRVPKTSKKQVFAGVFQPALI